MNLSPLVVELLKQFAVAAAPEVVRVLAGGFEDLAIRIVQDESLDNRQTVAALERLLEARKLTITLALED